MNFRLPLQISRVSTLCRSNSPEKLVSKFISLYGNHVENKIQVERNSILESRKYINKCIQRTIRSPLILYDQKAFIHNISDTEKEVSARVRAEQGCDQLCPEEPELAFRQTTKISCCNCMACKPCIAPPLYRPEKLYDDSKCSYNHKCNPNLCNIDPPRMDDLKCYKIKRKYLPCLPPSDCPCCMDELKKPSTLPTLCPPQKYYDPSILKREHKYCEELPCPRMDDVCGLKVVPKELPPIPSYQCQPCITIRPLTAPTLCRPACRYDATCLPYHHTSCPKETCNIDPPRRDNWSCGPICRTLPPVPCSSCEPCFESLPTECPILNRPMPMYDASEMKYKHECPITPCDIPALRRDNIISVKLTKKLLPKLDNNDCKPCCNFRPLTAPALGRPKLFNCSFQNEQERYDCIEEHTFRRDSQICISRKCLPPVPKSRMCKPCKDIFTPCRTPYLAPLEKLYDDTCCKYRHKCIPDVCEVNPRMDDFRCQEIYKTLPILPDSPDTPPCVARPTFAPPLCRPCKAYDDTTHKYRHPECPQDLCNIDPPRADDITGITDEVKVLQTYRPLVCCPCQVDVPCTAPILCRPRARYDSTCMPYNHKYCPTPCEPATRRDYFLCEAPKKLPKLKKGNICKECQAYYPSTTPALGLPCKLYEFPCDPVRIKECPEECPPRRDDLCCWKPKRKKLPKFNECDQHCCYSTCSWNNTRDLATQNIKYTIRPKVRHGKILQKNEHVLSKRNNSNEIVASITQLQKNEKIHGDSCKTNLNSPDITKLKNKNIAPKKNALAQNRYLVVGDPTWKKMEENKNAIDNKKFDYSIEKWLKEGAEEIAKVQSKNKSNKTTNSLMSYLEYNQMDIPQNSATEPLNITPNKFTDYDKTKFCEHLCIKKNNKLQPLKIGKYNTKNLASPSKINGNTYECTGKKEKAKCTVRVSRANTINYSNCKLASASLSKQPKLQNQFKEKIVSTRKMTNGDLILKFNEKLRLKFLKKIFNFIKQRDSSDKLDMKSGKINTGPSISGKSWLHANNKGLNKNKSCSLQTRKSSLGSKNKMEIPIRCYSSKLLNKNKKAIVKNQTFPKNKKPNERKFSTSSNGDINMYNHINISDDYIGKIYKVKLKKIGVKNIMLEKNDPEKRDEEPHTICYICKIVPRHQPIFCDDTPDIKNVNINYYKENRNTIE